MIMSLLLPLPPVYSSLLLLAFPAFLPSPSFQPIISDLRTKEIFITFRQATPGMKKIIPTSALVSHFAAVHTHLVPKLLAMSFDALEALYDQAWGGKADKKKGPTRREENLTTETE